MTPAGLALAQLIIVYGIPQALKIYEILSKPTITDVDIVALRDIKPPESYLVVK